MIFAIYILVSVAAIIAAVFAVVSFPIVIDALTRKG